MSRFELLKPKKKTDEPSSDKEGILDIKKQEKEGVSEDVCKVAEETIQKLTDSFIKKVEEHLVQKEAEIMKV